MSESCDGADLAWLGLTRLEAGRWRFPLTTPLSRFDGKFYGGTGVAAVTAIMEAESGRHAVWATVQFVSTTGIGTDIDCSVEVLAEGRRTSQVRVTASVGDETLFSALGSTAEVRRSPLEAQFGSMPDVPLPDDSESWRPVLPNGRVEERTGWLSHIELRHAGEGGSLWARMNDRPLTRAALGFVADVVPSGVVRAAGRAGAGTSLDNSIRFGPDPVGDWVLIDIDPHLISGGYVHGAARLWATDGTLLAVASQSASLLLFD
jgi:acyl-CoA thioesterase